MVGRVGADLYGRFQRESLGAAGVHTDFVTTDADAASGVALIMVERGGNNTIVVAPGAVVAARQKMLTGRRRSSPAPMPSCCNWRSR